MFTLDGLIDVFLRSALVAKIAMVLIVGAFLFQFVITIASYPLLGVILIGLMYEMCMRIKPWQQGTKGMQRMGIKLALLPIVFIFAVVIVADEKSWSALDGAELYSVGVLVAAAMLLIFGRSLLRSYHVFAIATVLGGTLGYCVHRVVAADAYFLAAVAIIPLVGLSALYSVYRARTKESEYRANGFAVGITSGVLGCVSIYLAIGGFDTALLTASVSIRSVFVAFVLGAISVEFATAFVGVHFGSFKDYQNESLEKGLFADIVIKNHTSLSVVYGVGLLAASITYLCMSYLPVTLFSLLMVLWLVHMVGSRQLKPNALVPASRGA